MSLGTIGINFSYVISAGLFVFGLKMLSSPATARRGNLLSALGMLVAIIAHVMAHASICLVEYISKCQLRLI